MLCCPCTLTTLLHCLCLPQVGSLQLVGVSLAQWLPCIIQFALLPLAMQPGRAHSTAGLAAKISLGAAGALCLAALSSLNLLLAECHAAVAAVAAAPQNDLTIRGAVCAYGGGLIWRRRVLWLAPICLLTFRCLPAPGP
jgi:hypothetical protein